MTTPIDPTKIFTDMISAANGAVAGDITAMGGYAEAKLQAIAKQASMIGTAYASGGIEESELPHFLDGLKDMVTSFVAVLEGLAVIAAEKAWNAMVGVLWDAIGTAAGMTLTPAKP